MPVLQKKVCLLGDFAVGKTSLVHRFVEGTFSDKYLSTIGAKVSRKLVSVQGRMISMLIWDLVGGEATRLMRNYYRGASGAILVCDLTRNETFDVLIRYAESFREVNPKSPIIIVGNKVDLITERAVDDSRLAHLASKFRTDWYTTSAKTGEHVEELFLALGHRMLG
jgi:small GTP-binding protein